ncbi:MAG: peptidylprolyl isomerase [Vampirovibrionales bacterium]|nr:peptidylprolyl isomerase [Vampirovibrionales bacterium]
MTASPTTDSITDNMVVSMRYTLKDSQGELIDASGDAPLEYLQGCQNIIPGLEKELSGLKVGDKKSVVVSAEEGYGPYNEGLKVEIPKAQFAQDETPDIGMLVQLDSPQGPLMAQIVGIDENSVQLDMNHPLAGKALHFEVEITGIRAASEEEIAHGHPHGPDGHHH